MRTTRYFAAALIATCFGITHADAQTPAKLNVTPTSLKLKIGDSAQLNATVVDKDGKQVKKSRVLFYSLSRGALRVDRTGKVSAIRGGKFRIMVRVLGNRRLRATVSVEVAQPPIARIEFDARPTVYQHTTVRIGAVAIDERKTERPKAKIALTSSDAKIASVDELGNLTAHRLGKITLAAQCEKATAIFPVRVVENPVRELKLHVKNRDAQTGDVLRFDAVAKGADGKPVGDAPIFYAFFARPDDDLGPSATGQIAQDGRFVAEKPGTYTIVASSGKHTARATVKIRKRDVQQRFRVLGHAPVRDVHTSDLWVWTGADGKDYCVTGTWAAKGEAYFWDVTNPRKMKKISTIKVDARTVNDVKVSEDGKICVISREGASNRKNGIVILDVSNPAKVKILSTFNDQLTGGVHNVFIYKDHVYAVNNGRRYDIINIADPTKPHRVGRFELKTPGHSLHDVWIVDGIAYSSNWRNGVVLVDVGNGIAGGSPKNPVKIGQYKYPSGWNHAAFPYKSKKTGKFYVIAGDEKFPSGLYKKGRPTIPAGWIHFIDFTSLSQPKEVARYEVPEAGTHNMWVDGDTLYVAYYNGGLRVVDISGELMGDLYRQGREIAKFVPYDPKGKVANAPMTWGPQPHKGVIFISDWNSGLWAVQLIPRLQAKKK